MAKKYSTEWWNDLAPEKVGKETEKLVEALFNKWNERINFAWHRLPDAKAGRGFIKAQPADYMYRCGSYSGFIEVKALKHAFRLPAARLTQHPTLNKWGLAGSSNVVLVHHYLQGVWRAINVVDLPFGVTSWDLSGFEEHASAEEALLSLGFFGGLR